MGKCFRKLFFSFLIICLSGLWGCAEARPEEEANQGNFVYLIGRYPIMETEMGYYYNKAESVPGMELHFFDKQSHKDIILCSKPECAHDKNTFCAATSDRTVQYMALYGGYLYISSIGHGEEDTVNSKLYRAALDGTELTQIAVIKEYKSDIISQSDHGRSCMVIYKNTAFIPYDVSNREDSWSNLGLAMVDLSTGGVTYLEEYSSEVSRGYQKITPYGSYLYYSIGDAWGKNEKLYRYHLETKKTEKFEDLGKILDFCIVDGEVVFTKLDEGGIGRLYAFHPETNAVRELNGEITDAEGQPVIDEWGGQLCFDGAYLVLSDSKGIGQKENYYVFDKKGAYLCSYSAPEAAKEYADNVMAIVNGNVYFQCGSTVMYCPMEEILKGNVRYETAYEMEAESLRDKSLRNED